MKLIEKLNLKTPLAYPEWQFNLLKISISIYIVLHFFFLYSKNPFTPIIQNDWLLLLGTFSAITIAFEKTRRLGSFITWLCLSFFFKQNIFLFGINHDYIGWLLLALTCIDAPFNKTMSKVLFWGAWLILSLGYFVSGLSKYLITDLWITGLAGELSFQVFNRFDIFGAEILKPMTYIVLVIEFLFPFACLNKFSRFFFFIGISLIHLILFTFTYCTEISASVLIWHIFVFDPRWLTKSYWRTIS